jgi:hypothetical protein
MSLKVGDRVRVVQSWYLSVSVGKVGTIKQFHWEDGPRSCYGVVFDVPIDGAPEEYGWSFRDDELELIGGKMSTAEEKLEKIRVRAEGYLERFRKLPGEGLTYIGGCRDVYTENLGLINDPEVLTAECIVDNGLTTQENELFQRGVDLLEGFLISDRTPQAEACFHAVEILMKARSVSG